MPYDLRRERSRTMAVWGWGWQARRRECHASGAVCETSEWVKPATEARKQRFHHLIRIRGGQGGKVRDWYSGQCSSQKGSLWPGKWARLAVMGR